MKKITLNELKSLVKQIIKEESNKLTQINKEKAEELFNKGIYIYLKTNNLPPDSNFNLFAINNKTWDGSMNIYKKNLTPIEYGFENIINWVEERIDKPLTYHTLYSKEPITFP